MRVLWFSVTPSLYDEKLYGGWVASLERLIKSQCPDIKLGIAFEHNDRCFKMDKNGTTYYPIYKSSSFINKLDILFHFDAKWRLLKPHCIKIIQDFKPDIIQCFGSEWPFALITQDINIPVIVHMQGFSNIYRLSSSMCLRLSDIYKYYHYNLIRMLHYWYRSKKGVASDLQEQKLMKMNHFFMGRTDWDRNIVKYYSSDAKYYYCPEAIRPEIIHSTRIWSFKPRKKMRLVTISSASSLKGNDLILRTANILKQFNFDFEWRISGSKDSLKFFESILGLRHDNLNIKLLGYISSEQIIDELANADVYVHTAIIDNSPNSLCEAQLIGCPVISTNVGGIPQLVDNGKTGILYPYNEPHTLAFILMNIFGQKDLLERISTNELIVSHERHDEVKIVERLHSIYNEIISLN